MNDKSFVTLEKHQCMLCLTLFETGALLLDKTLRDRFEKFTVTNHGVCPKCQAKIDEGFIGFIQAGPDCESMQKVFNTPGGYLGYGFISEETFKQIFDVQVPKQRVVLLTPEVVDFLKSKPHEEIDPSFDDKPTQH